GGDYLRREYEDLRREYEDLRREYEDLRREYEDLRRPFTIASRAHSTDARNPPTIAPYHPTHPCEQPSTVLRHMSEPVSRPGGRLLDPFAGSGSTLEAARDTGRHAIGIEQDERYCEAIATRLAQGTFDFASLTEGIAG